MKGRLEDWADDLSSWPFSVVLPSVAVAGFDGIYVDRYAYQDRARGLETELRSKLGIEPLVASSGRMSFFDLRPFARRLWGERSSTQLDALREAALQPLTLSPGPNLWAAETEGQHRYRWAVAPEVHLVVENPSSFVRTARIQAVLERAGENPTEILATLPDRSVVRLTTPSRNGANRLDRTLELQPGTNLIRFETAAAPQFFPGDPRSLYFRLVDVRLTDSAFAPFLSSG
jgi:hypothetical protein